ncbi:VOC family protein [Arenimonas terrae]|jgi:predicted enzyme related to lactoylglutathione lyase|uniref:VOC family protein n=1 Tax=Arenimonas terrae TaxID=2546226 RepID=A0A5C4RWR5_9GAMM|nr:VOC family protein [Arenimonas terrae]TNJ35415.1 VOC family protein [Arenimonas terrae]
MSAPAKPRVHGIGGIFFKARDPGALGAWYTRHLGMDMEAWGGTLFHWKRADTGGDACTVFSAFKESTEYFLPSDKPYMINLRVDDLDAVLAALREEGCRVLDRREDSEQGKFGYVLDPEGGLIELWQPNPDDPSQQAGA